MSETLIIALGFLLLAGFIAWMYRGRIKVLLKGLGLEGRLEAESPGSADGITTKRTVDASPPPGLSGDGDTKAEASGERSVAIGGSANGSTIVTGKNNKVGR